jgi:hypothetical protein
MRHPPREAGGTLVKKLLLALVAVVGLYVASPYVAVALLLRAANQADEGSLASRVDFDAIRTSLSEQFEARMVKPGESIDPMQRMMLNTMISGFASPRGVAMLLRNRGQMTPTPDEPVGAGGSGSKPDGAPRPRFGLDDLDLDWFFFTSPMRFEAQSRGGALVLEPRGLWWRLVDVKLPPRERGSEPPPADVDPTAPAPELAPLNPETEDPSLP